MKLFRKKMNTCFITFLLAVCFAAALLCAAAPAARAANSRLDATKPCSLTVSTPADYPELAQPDSEGNPKTFTVHAWLVATVDDDVHYTLTQAFNSGISFQGYTLTDLNEYKATEGTTDLKKITELATALYGAAMGVGREEAEEAASAKYAPPAPEGEENPSLPVARKPDSFAIEPDYTFTVTGGVGTLTDVPAGYYLILPEDIYDEEYVYIYAPTLISVPHLDLVLPGESEAPAPEGADPAQPYEDWVYDVNARLKPERDYRRGGIVIRKHLTAYNEALQGADFVFSVSAVKSGKVVYSNVIKLHFDEFVTDKAYVINDLPVGSIVTVKEEYSGSCYEIVDPATQTQTADVVCTDTEETEDDLVEFVFVNQPNARVPKNVTVLNHYELLNDGTYGHHNEYEDSTQENSQK